MNNFHAKMRQDPTSSLFLFYFLKTNLGNLVLRNIWELEEIYYLSELSSLDLVSELHPEMRK